MNQEKKYLLLVLVGLLLVATFAFILWVWDVDYLVLFLALTVIFSILLSLILYLRIQHNIDSKFKRTESAIKQSNSNFISITERLDQQKIVSNRTLDLMDKMIDHFKNNLDELKEITEKGYKNDLESIEAKLKNMENTLENNKLGLRKINLTIEELLRLSQKSGKTEGKGSRNK